MTDTLMALIGIILAILIMFIFPVMAVASQHDEIAQTVVETAVTEFVTNIAEKGRVTEFDYNELMQRISATGNTYDVQIEVQLLDDNPERKTVTTDKNIKGENLYYSVYTENITEKILEKKEYALKKDDYVVVTVKNNNITIGTQFKNFLYSIVGKDVHTIGASSAAIVMNSGQEEQAQVKGEKVPEPVVDITVALIEKNVKITNTDIIFILDDSGSMRVDGRSYVDVENACCNILDAMIAKGLNNNFYIGFVRFSSEYNGHPAAEEIGYMTNASQLAQMKSKIIAEYGKNGGTVFAAGFNKAIDMIKRDLNESNNTRIIVFMTDGVDQDSKPEPVIASLKNIYGVDQLFIIGCKGDGTSYNAKVLQSYVDSFGAGQFIESTSANLTNAFTNILYSVNEAKPQRRDTVDGKLLLAGMQVSADKPVEITVEQYGTLVKKITITNPPTTGSGILFVQRGQMYLSVSDLANACGLTTLEDVNVTVSYFSNK